MGGRTGPTSGPQGVLDLAISDVILLDLMRDLENIKHLRKNITPGMATIPSYTGQTMGTGQLPFVGTPCTDIEIHEIVRT